jgi:hypothetical protein
MDNTAGDGAVWVFGLSPDISKIYDKHERTFAHDDWPPHRLPRVLPVRTDDITMR